MAYRSEFSVLNIVDCFLGHMNEKLFKNLLKEIIATMTKKKKKAKKKFVCRTVKKHAKIASLLHYGCW